MNNAGDVVLSVEHLIKHFPLRGSRDVVHAVNDVSFEISRGETFALVGESGSGKTTIGRSILKLTEPTSGRIGFAGLDIGSLSPKEFRKFRPRVQMVFQEPYQSLNPRLTIRKIVEENLRLEGRLDQGQREARIWELLEMVDLRRALLDRYPYELTGGEQQRVSIARAISTNPDLVVLDEPTSALDISVRAQIIRLLRELQRETGIAYLFISHDLTAVKEIGHRVGIMYLGEIVEAAPNPEIFDYQLHPYAQALLASVLFPQPDAEQPPVTLNDEIPSPVHLPSGCHLHPRCQFALPECATEWPTPTPFGNDRIAACHRSREFLPEAVIKAGWPKPTAPGTMGDQQEARESA